MRFVVLNVESRAKADISNLGRRLSLMIYATTERRLSKSLK